MIILSDDQVPSFSKVYLKEVTVPVILSVVVDVVTLLLALAIVWASAALRLEIGAVVAVAEVVAVEVHDYYSPRRCMAIVVRAVEVCHDLSCWWWR